MNIYLNPGQADIYRNNNLLGSDGKLKKDFYLEGVFEDCERAVKQAASAWYILGKKFDYKIYDFDIKMEEALFKQIIDRALKLSAFPLKSKEFLEEIRKIIEIPNVKVDQFLWIWLIEVIFDHIYWNLP